MLRVPLNEYPDLLSSVHLTQLLGCSPSQARRIIEQMDHTDICPSGKSKRTLRVSKVDIAQKYKLTQSLHMKRGKLA